MYNVELTREKFGEVGPLWKNPWVVKTCKQCGKNDVRRYGNRKKHPYDYYCTKCIVNRPEVKKKKSDFLKQQWQDPEYAEKIKNNSKELWKNATPELRKKMRDCFTKPETLAKIIHSNKTRWNKPEFRSKMLALWHNPDYRAKIERVHVSCLQTLLYSILDDLGVKYFREYSDKQDDQECKIGPYSFDCVIPRENKPTLLIECNGDYWHSLPKNIKRDKAKATYIINNFPEQYELKSLWEHEFNQLNKIVSVVKYWLGLEDEIVEYNLKDVVIKPVEHEQTKLFLSKYHYIHSPGRSGSNLGAFFGDELIAVAVFGFLPRQNISFEGYKREEVRDLSRFCIHPKYRKKNLGSWFLKRCLKQLPDDIKLVISYADTTFNHTGALYKSSNFVLDKVVAPDYWYVSNDGWAMHKKTLYNQAVRMGLTERDYAELHGYVKIWGKEKLRFIYKLDR